jgi:hypothetical protein
LGIYVSERLASLACFGSSFAMWQLFLDRCNASPASAALVDAELPGVLSGKNPQVVSIISQKQIGFWVLSS